MDGQSGVRMPASAHVFRLLRERGVPVPSAVSAQGAYGLVVIGNGLAFTSGQLPRLDDADNIMFGRLSVEDDLGVAQAAARLCLARTLVALHQALGDLDKLGRLLSLRGYVNANAAFTRHGAVMDAASQLALEVLGPAGWHSRTSVGVGSLPAGALVEIEAVAALA